MRTWELQVAKNHLSEVVELSLTEGPQLVRRCSTDLVIIISVEDYRRLVGDTPNLVDHLPSAPRGKALVINRSKEPIRDFDL